MSIIRELRERDIPILLELFCETIKAVNVKDYSHEQVSIWGSKSRVEKNWKSSFDNKHIFIFEDEGKVLGFCELREDGYIDRFYTDANFIGKGVGSSLYSSLEDKAKVLGIAILFVDASITAKPFFEKMNFALVKEQNVSLSGVDFINYKMEKALRD